MVKILSCYRLNIFTSPGDKYYIMLKGIILLFVMERVNTFCLLNIYGIYVDR